MKKLLFSLVALSAVLISGCQKDDKTDGSDNADVLHLYKDINPETLHELQMAHGATAKYQRFENATKDQYEDIQVVLPNMGYHFMKKSVVDGTFNPSEPELLVYNKRLDGSFELGAIEYAVPKALSPNAPPEGFTGPDDVWTTFGDFWVLHVWIYKFNPDGIFSPMNSTVIVH